MRLKIRQRREVLKTYPFTVEELDLDGSDGPLPRPYHRLIAPDWVNVLAVTPDQQAVMIRQQRIGVMQTILEVPGGMVDKGETDPTLTAARELEEETGYTSQRLLSLGSLNANPAIMTNRCHFFLALGCQKPAERQHFPDADEHIEVELVPVAELEQLVRTGRIDHSLSALAVLLAKKYLPQMG